MTELMTEKSRHELLIESAKGGDRAALEELLREYRPRLRQAVEMQLRDCPGAVEFDDVVQETLVRAFESVGRFAWQGEDSFYFWLCGIARNVILKFTEEARRLRFLRVPEHVAGSQTTPSRALRREERQERLEQALAQLSPEYREVLRLSRLERLKIKEIAQRMQRSEFAVKHLMARAMRQLRATLRATESLHLPDRPLDLGGGDRAGE